MNRSHRQLNLYIVFAYTRCRINSLSFKPPFHGAKGDQGVKDDTGAQGATGVQGDQDVKGDTGA